MGLLMQQHQAGDSEAQVVCINGRTLPAGWGRCNDLACAAEMDSYSVKMPLILRRVMLAQGSINHPMQSFFPGNVHAGTGLFSSAGVATKIVA